MNAIKRRGKRKVFYSINTCFQDRMLEDFYVLSISVISILRDIVIKINQTHIASSFPALGLTAGLRGGKMQSPVGT